LAWLAGAVGALALAAGAATGTYAQESQPPSAREIRSRADALLAEMTPEEKAGQLTQLFQFGPVGSQETGTAGEIAAGRVGSLLFVNDPEQINQLQRIALERSRLKIPLLFGYDVIHGLRTIFPVPIAMAATWDPPLVERAQAVAAEEARAVGIQWTFAPMVDIARDPRWGRIVEGAGEDPYLGSAMAAASVRGFQGPYLGAPGHIIAGPKHFAGYGASLGGRDYDEVNLSDQELWNIHLPPFKAAIDAGAGNVMAAYMGLNGVPGAANEWLLTEVLRREWGFEGFVVSDANGVNDLKTHGVAADDAAAAALAVGAGLDLEMAAGKAAMRSLPAALKEGAVSMETVDSAVRRLLEAKIRLGLFDNPYVDANQAAHVLNDPAHRELARAVAQRSTVLLRNEGNLLPLDRDAIDTVAVIGPLADSARDTLGPWVFKFDLDETVTVLEGLRAELGDNVEVTYSEGVRMPSRLHPSPFDALEGQRQALAPLDEEAEIARAVGLAQAADVAILVLGEAQNMIGEAASRSSLDLPGRQQELLDAVVKTGKPVVLLLMSARPLDLKGTEAPAVMTIWYPGTQGGAAVADLLFGDVPPGGKLPFTWPQNIGQVPLIYSRLTSHKPQDAERRYWNEQNAPLYPFGHGLSYSTFGYSDLRVERSQVPIGQPVEVSMILTNTGKVTADEVAQLYLHQRVGTSARPVRELKGFQRVTLAPGERRTLRFTLSPEDLRYWSQARREWVQDASTFDVWVGGSSTAELATTFETVAAR